LGQTDLDQLFDLVGCIYDVALSSDGWDPLLERTTEMFGGTATVFFVQDRHAAGLQFSRLWGLPQQALQEFESHFAPVDVGLDSLLALPPASVVTDESTPPEIYRSSEIYNDFRRRWTAERYMACDVFRDERRFGVLAVQGSSRRAPFDSTETDVIRRLLPHLRRAVQIRANLSRMEARQRALEDLIDGLLVGVVLLNDAGEVIHANAAARRIDRLEDGLQIRRGRLSAASSTDDRVLRQAIATAIGIANRTSLEGGGVLRIRRPSRARPFSVLVTPGPGVDSQSPFSFASALVVIGDPDAGPACGPDLAAHLYGLTPAEARLAHAIARGESLETYAETQGIALSTARWTTKQVLAKTGSRRQADLVRLLLTGPAAVCKPASNDG
jgi:DNA-binding CsgD family transcriptional regulator/PAS domain-containing protein